MRNLLLFFTILVSIRLYAQQVELIFPNIDANFDESVTLNGEIFFSANDGIYGWELWKSDGTKAGTKLALDIKPGSRFESSSPRTFKKVGNNFIFHAAPTKGSSATQLYYGNNNTIEQFRDAYNPNSFTEYQDRIYFKAVTLENKPLLCVTDGTKNGTKIISSALASNFEILLFESGLYVKQNVGLSLLNTTNNSLTNIVEFKNYSTLVPYQVHCTEKTLYLLYRDNSSKRDNRLVSFDLDKKEFLLCKTFFSLIPSNVFIPLLEHEKKIYFPADDGSFGRELWVSDGTIDGTKILVEPNVGGGSSYHTLHGIYNGVLLYTSFIRNVSSFDNKLYVFTYDLKTNTLKTLRNEKGQPFRFGYAATKISENKVHLYVDVHINDPDPSDPLYFNNFYLKSKSGYFNYNFLTDKIEPSIRIATNYIIGEKSYYSTGGYCSGRAIESIDLNTNKVTSEFLFLPKYLDGTGTGADDDRLIASFKLLNNGVIAAKRIEDPDYPPRFFGIYFAKKCSNQIDLNITENEINICRLGTTSFEVNNDEFLSYNWRFNCSSPSITKTLNLSPTESGNLTVIAKDKDGCFVSKNVKVNYLDVSIVGRIDGNQNICKNQSTTLIGSASQGESPYTYFWFNKDNSQQLSNLDSVKLNASGKYIFKVKDSKGCESPQYEFEIFDLSPRNTTITGEKLLKVDQETALSVTGVSGQQYQWYKDGVELVGKTSNSIKVSEIGTYHVKISNSSCSVESEKFRVDIITALESTVKRSNFKIYPNPTADYLILQVSDNSLAEAQIVDAKGSILKKYRLNEKENTLDLNGIGTGNYLIRVIVNEKQEVFKISVF